jgi:putative transcriptional regulator
VKDYREAHGGMTQAQLGEAVGVTRHTIIAIEQGHYSPSLETAFRIARLFGVGVEDVFGWEG